MSKKKHDPARPSVEELKKALLAVNLQLQGAYQRFDYLCEPELIEACIFEINALKARYNYLLRCLKEQTGDSRARRRRPGEVGVSPPRGSIGEAGSG